MLQTIKLPMDEASRWISRFSFFSCVTCALEEGSEERRERQVLAQLLDADIKHYCDDCGRQLTALRGIVDAEGRLPDPKEMNG